MEARALSTAFLARVSIALGFVLVAPPAQAICDIGLADPEGSTAAVDASGDGLWGAGDAVRSVAVFAGPGQILVGDWNGDGVDELAKLLPYGSGGSARPYFYVDLNGSGAWEGTAGGDRWANWLSSTFFAGGNDVSTFQALAWDNSVADVVAYYAPLNQRFVVDLNGDVIWNGVPGGDFSFRFAVFAGPGQALLGDWDGDGDDDAGVVVGNRFLLDANGNQRWDGIAGGDRNTPFSGHASGIPIAGDWNGDGADEIGRFLPPGTFLLDVDGDGVWDGAPEDATVELGGAGPATWPLVCDWNGDGADDVGVADDEGLFTIDLDGDRALGPGDRSLAFTPGATGPAQPIAGVWSAPPP